MEAKIVLQERHYTGLFDEPVHRPPLASGFSFFCFFFPLQILHL